MQFDLSSKKPAYSNQTDWISLDKSQRINLHPLFKSIEDFNCKVNYHLKLKCFFVEYGYNENTSSYEKGVLSHSITEIVDDVTSYYSLV
jgi:hypothetical protein